MDPTALTLSFIGSGNIAWHLATGWKAFTPISYIYSRNLKTSLELAEETNAKATFDLENVLNADVVIIAVQDNQILTIAKEIRKKRTKSDNPVLMHTSGYIPSEVLMEADLESYGVLYPLQSMKKGKSIRLDHVPFFITASDERAEKTIFHLARLLSPNVHTLTDEQRQVLHLAAVMVNNFTHHIMVKAQEYLENNKLDPAWLIPLSEETVNSAFKKEAIQRQTGPARRGDHQVIEGHLNQLLSDPHLFEMYQSITNSIIHTYQDEDRS